MNINKFNNDFIKRYKNKCENEKESIFSFENQEKNEKEIKNKTNFSYRNYSKNQNKFINLNDGDFQLFQKFVNKQVTMDNSNTNIKRKINSKNNIITQNKNTFNKANKTLNYAYLNNSKNSIQNINSNINKSKPFKLKILQNQQNTKVFFQTYYTKNESYRECNNNYYNINEKLNFLKNKFNFKGNNEEFIKYLKIVKLKSDITCLVEILFNNGENLNEEKAKECFNKLGNLLFIN